MPKRAYAEQCTFILRYCIHENNNNKKIKPTQLSSNILEEFLARQKQLGGMYWLSMCKQCKNTEYE